MSAALITGITGQDGSYLAEFMLARGYTVIGVVRDVAAASRAMQDSLKSRVVLAAWDMMDQESFAELLRHYRPAEVYNFAAYSSGARMYEDPVGMAEVNGVAVARMLEVIRTVDPRIRFCQASSREIFGNATESPQSEQTMRNPRSPYGAAKAYADAMIRIYREHHGLFACAAILFNHESPRRPREFVTRKITHEAARISLGLSDRLALGNLDTVRDWGFAADYVRAMWLMLQQARADDYVIASGEAHTVRELCETAFGHLNLDYRNYVHEDPGAYRPSEAASLVGNAGKARQILGWSPEVGFRELVEMMVDADVRLVTEQVAN